MYMNLKLSEEVKTINVGFTITEMVFKPRIE